MTLLGGCLKKNSSIRIVFRADGNSTIGLGHVIRCISLIQILEKEFECIFISNNPPDQVSNLVSSYCKLFPIYADSLKDEEAITIPLIKSNDIFVSDGYGFTPEYQFAIKQKVKKLVCVDDLASQFFHADVIINHGSTMWESSYKTSIGTKIFTGFPYLIARKEFLSSARQLKIIKEVNNVFICMGGADPFNITEKVLDACLQSTFLKKVIIVTGSVYKNKSILRSLVSSSNKILVEHIENADAEQIVKCIQQSQIAITTASSIALEVCCVKAALLCGTVIDNQNSIHTLLIQNQCCISVGSWVNVEVEDIKEHLKIMNDTMLVQKIVDNQSSCVDGKSNERILEIFRELAG
jgi:UDP-2,4-diacetamido-2,4,6-trideoxy-beta-L-altropyranose hydrolase